MEVEGQDEPVMLTSIIGLFTRGFTPPEALLIPLTTPASYQWWWFSNPNRGPAKCFLGQVDRQVA